MAKSNPGGGGTDNSKKYGQILSGARKTDGGGKRYSMLKPMKPYSGKVLRVEKKMNYKFKKK